MSDTHDQTDLVLDLVLFAPDVILNHRDDVEHVNYRWMLDLSGTDTHDGPTVELGGSLWRGVLIT